MPAGEEMRDSQDHINDEQCIVQLIAAVAAVHELHKLLLEFCHKKTLSRGMPV